MGAAVPSRPPPPPPPLLVGLSREEEQRSAGQYFEAFPWEGVRLDPEAMSAEEFLDGVF